MSQMVEPTTVGLSASGKTALSNLVEAGVFSHRIDAYRFGVALAVAHGAYDSASANRETMFNVGTLDPDRSLHTAVGLLRGDIDEPVYRTIEKCAEWGIREMAEAFTKDKMRFSQWMSESVERARKPKK